MKELKGEKLVKFLYWLFYFGAGSLLATSILETILRTNYIFYAVLGVEILIMLIPVFINWRI